MNERFYPYLIGKMTTSEAKQALNQADLVIIPVGSTEQHSSNMTLETDTELAVQLALRLAERIAPKVVVAPAIPIGISYHHMKFSGSMTFKPSTMLSILTDYGESLKTHGVKKILLLNGHGGNQSVLSVFTTISRNELDVDAANVFYWNLASKEIREEAVSQRYGHACEIETSFGMYLAPYIVRSSQLQGSELLEYPYRHTGLDEGLRVDYPYRFDELTLDGSYGDARAATKEKGEKLIEIILDRLSEFIEDFCKNRKGDKR